MSAQPTREQILRDVIALAEHFRADKRMPVDAFTFRFSHCITGDDDERGMAELAQIADALGVEVTDDGGSHFYATKMFGVVQFQAYYVLRQHMADYSAFMATRSAWKAARDGVDVPPSPPEEVAGPVAVGPATAPIPPGAYVDERTGLISGPLPEDGHTYACCGKVGRISRHNPWCPAEPPEVEVWCGCLTTRLAEGEKFCAGCLAAQKKLADEGWTAAAERMAAPDEVDR
jgi:hypothetical protein